MFHIIFKDIKNMLKKPMAFLLLLFGLITAAASMIIYYSYGSININIRSTMYDQDKTLEVKSNGDPYSEALSLIDLLDSGEIPEAKYFAVVDYSSENYDLIGYREFEEYFTPSGGGDFLHSEDEGSSLAVVSEDFGEGQKLKVGDTFMLHGKQFTAKGIFIKNGFDPTIFDIRRVPQGAEYVAGMDFSLERDEEVKNRPSKIAVISLEDYLKICNIPSVYHISFKESLTSEQRADIEQIISNNTGLMNFTPITLFSETNSINQWSNSIIYFIAVVAGIINIIGLFAFFLKENKKQYSIYKLLGASNFRLNIIIYSELFIYTASGFIIALAGAIPIINTVEMFDKCSIPSISAILVLFMLIYLAAVLMCLSQIKAITRLKKTTLKANKRNKKKKTLPIGDTENIGNRFLYLLSFHYNKKNILGVASIFCLSIAVAFSFTYAMTYVFESNKLSRYIENNYSCELASISFNDNIILNSTNDLYSGKISSPSEYADIQEALDKVKNIGSVNHVDKIQIVYKTLWDEGEYQDKDSQGYNMTMFMNEYIDNVCLPLSKGSWEDMKGYDPADESAVIPCVLSSAAAKIHPYDSEFFAIIPFDTGITDISGNVEDGSISCKYLNEPVRRKFKVVGVISDETYMPTVSASCYGALDPDITLFLTPFNSDELHIIVPNFLHNGKEQFETELSDYYIYLSKDITEGDKERIREELKPYADVYFFSDLTQRYESLFSSGGGEVYVMHSIISGLLLLFGVGGFCLMQFSANKRTYGVYYICGMNWKKSITLTLTANAINTILPSIVGAVAGIVVASAIRGSFSIDSIIYSILCGIGLVILIYCLVNIVNSIYMKIRKPKNLLTEESK